MGKGSEKSQFGHLVRSVTWDDDGIRDQALQAFGYGLRVFEVGRMDPRINQFKDVVALDPALVPFARQWILESYPP
jgi:hypothetical protein